MVHRGPLRRVASAQFRCLTSVAGSSSEARHAPLLSGPFASGPNASPSVVPASVASVRGGASPPPFGGSPLPCCITRFDWPSEPQGSKDQFQWSKECDAQDRNHRKVIADRAIKEPNDDRSTTHKGEHPSRKHQLKPRHAVTKASAWRLGPSSTTNEPVHHCHRLWSKDLVPLVPIVESDPEALTLGRRITHVVSPAGAGTARTCRR